MTEEEVKQAIESHLRSLASGAATLKSHSFTTNWLAILVVGGLLFFLGHYISSQLHDKEELLHKAEEQKKTEEVLTRQLQAEERDRVAAMRTLTAQVAENQRTIAAILKRDAERDAKAQAQIADVMQPNRPVDKVVADAQTYLKVTPIIMPNGLLFKPEDVQTFSSTKIDRDRLAAKVEDDKVTIKKLNDSLTKATAQIAKSDIAIAQMQALMTQKDERIATLEKAAKKTGWQKVWDVAKNVGFIGLGIAIGAALH